MKESSLHQGGESQPDERLTLCVPSHIVASPESLESFLRVGGELSAPKMDCVLRHSLTGSG